MSEEKKEDIMTEDKLRNLSVIDLRKFVVKNKIFKGISNLKKREFINTILSSKWWKDNISKVVPVVSSDLKKQLEDDIKKCEKKLKETKKKIKPNRDEPKEQKTNSDREQKTNSDREQKTNSDREQKTNSDREQKTNRPDNINFADDDILTKLLPKIINDGLDELPAEKNEPKEQLPILPQIIPLEFFNEKHSEIDDDLLSHKEPQKKNIDIGHTIINIYCNGNKDPNIPIPQDVVREAINANNAPLYNQQELIEWIKEYLKSQKDDDKEEQNQSQNAPIYNTYIYGGHQMPQQQMPQQMPQQQMPQQMPQQTMSNIRSQFNKEPVKKWGDVKGADVLKSKTADEANVSKPNKDEPKEEKKDEIKEVKKFIDDIVEEETKIEKLKRETDEQIKNAMAQSSGNFKSEKFRNRLTGAFGKIAEKKLADLGNLENKPLVINKEPAKKWATIITDDEKKKLNEEALRKKLEE
jgi:hypothetical protein